MGDDVLGVAELRAMQADARRHRSDGTGCESCATNVDALAASLLALRAVVHSDEADRYRAEACRNAVYLPYANNRYVRLLDDVRAALGVE